MSFVSISEYYDMHRPGADDVTDILASVLEINKSGYREYIILNPEYIFYDTRSGRVKFTRAKKAQNFDKCFKELMVYFQRITVYSDEYVKQLVIYAYKLYGSKNSLKDEKKGYIFLWTFIICVILIYVIYYSYLMPIEFYG